MFTITFNCWCFRCARHQTWQTALIQNQATWTAFDKNNYKYYDEKGWQPKEAAAAPSATIKIKKKNIMCALDSMSSWWNHAEGYARLQFTVRLVQCFLSETKYQRIVIGNTRPCCFKQHKKLNMQPHTYRFFHADCEPFHTNFCEDDYNPLGRCGKRDALRLCIAIRQSPLMW